MLGCPNSLTPRSGRLKPLGLICAFVGLLPLAHADVYAFRDESGHLRWTNSTDPSAGASHLVAVLPSPAGSSASPNPQSTPSKKTPSARSANAMSMVRSAARKYGLDPAVLLALIDVESSFNSEAVSSTGARGLMQLMPATARQYGLRRTLDLHDPAVNVDLGARHLSDLLAAHQGNLTMALASYNAGQPAVKRHGGAIPAYRETMLYVPAVLSRIHAYRSPESVESPHAF